MNGRQLALASFWTERPLVRLFQERTGTESFSLKQLIEFAEQLPPVEIAELEKQRDGRSQRPSQAVARTRRQSHDALRQQNHTIQRMRRPA